MGAPIEFEGVESIYTLEILIETLENLDFIKETSLDSNQNWLESLFHLTCWLLLKYIPPRFSYAHTHIMINIRFLNSNSN